MSDQASHQHGLTFPSTLPQDGDDSDDLDLHIYKISNEAKGHFEACLVHAPAKVILFGEHAAVYDKHVLGTAINLYCFALVEPVLEQVIFRVPDMEIECSWPTDTFSKATQGQEALESRFRLADAMATSAGFEGKRHRSVQAFLVLALCLGLTHPCRVTVVSEIAMGAGLGSSAAYCTCLVQAIFITQGRAMFAKELLEWSRLAEKIIHGIPTTIDCHLAIYRNTSLFKKGAGRYTKALQLDTKLRCLVINTGVSRNTCDMLARVKHLREQAPEDFESIIDDIETVTMEAAQNIQDVNKLKSLIPRAQHLLEKLDVSHQAIQRVIQILQPFGFSAKLTGAGGGGHVIALVDSTQIDLVDQAIKELTHNGFTAFLAAPAQHSTISIDKITDILHRIK